MPTPHNSRNEQRPISFSYVTYHSLPLSLRKRTVLKDPKNQQVTTKCWVWIGGHNSGGYGQLVWKGQRDRMAHKVVYELFNGPVPKGLELDHLCCVADCVNPEHLEPVTRAENLRRSHTTGFGNGTRTHCRRGHAFTPENTYQWRGKRLCRKCGYLRTRQKVAV